MSTNTTKSASPSKAAQAIKLLSRAKGAALTELTKATAWQPHSCRAFLTGLRKKGYVIVREARGDNMMAYRITTGPAESSSTPASSDVAVANAGTNGA